MSAESVTSTVAEPTAAVWQPQFKLDLKTASAEQFANLVDQFEEWRKTQPEDDADMLADGWHLITPEKAERLLLRNPAGANRKVSFAAVVYYALQMLADDWPETGQAIIFDILKRLLDGQHRLWAGYLSGVPFWTYIVNQRKAIPSAFAYIDNVKARTPKDALVTAGLNGLSGLSTQVVIMAQHYFNGAYTPTKKHKMPKMSPKQVIDYFVAHPNIRQAVYLMAGEHASASAMIYHKDVAAFTAVLILDAHNELTLDDFMGEVGVEDDTHFAAGSPIGALQHLLKQDRLAKEPMTKHQILGHVIKAFNYWHLGEQKKKITLPVSEPFPSIIAPEPEAQAA